MVNIRQVGEPDPRQKTSLIEGLDKEAGGEPTTGETCYFNSEEYGRGTEVQSGDAILRCEGGSWRVIQSPAQQPS